MRVTDRMLFDRAVTDGGAARARLESAVERASTGLQLTHPGDDPAAAGQLVRLRAAGSRAQALGDAAGKASDELAIADAALGEIVNSLNRVRELTMQLGSDGYTAAERANGAAEVKSLMDQIVGLLNTKVGSRYVFSGMTDATTPFSAAGTYLGDARVRQVEVAPGVFQNTSLRADSAFKGVGGGVDVLSALNSLRTALLANDQPGTVALLGNIGTGIEQVAALRGQAGIAMVALDGAVTVNRMAEDAAVTSAAHLTDADAIQANTELALAQRALEAALTATAKGFKLSLLDFLP